MRKLFFMVLTVFVFAACQSAPPPPASDNPGVGPELLVVIPELFSPDPDIVDDVITISITVNHPVAIKDWNIVIQPERQRVQVEQVQRTEGREGRQRTGQGRRVFFEQSGNGTPATQWTWNGRSTARAGELVQSATDYQFILSVNDIYNNNTVYEGKITTDVIVRREGENLRIIVPAITFEADKANFTEPVGEALTEEQIRSNRWVVSRIANALNRYPDYRIVIEGHANPMSAAGSANRRNQETNLLSLSEQRARAVGTFLTANHNISATRFSYVGMGTSRTVIDFANSDEFRDEAWKNRRVEFLLQR